MRRQRGFTLIELLIVVAIIGIIAAIAIPNLLNAINRGRQKRTMADIRSIATAIESYSVDMNFYPRGVAAFSELSGILTPTYIRTMPNQDGWANAFIAESDTDGSTYTLGSSGKDGATDTSLDLEGTGGPTGDFNHDIIFRDGQFVQWPEGVQN